MKEIVLKEDFAFLYCKKSLYSISAIKKAKEEFAEFLEIQVQELGLYFVLQLKRLQLDYPLEELSFEFLNYCLAKAFEEK